MYTDPCKYIYIYIHVHTHTYCTRPHPHTCPHIQQYPHKSSKKYKTLLLCARCLVRAVITADLRIRANPRICTLYALTQAFSTYGVASISRPLKIIGRFCKRALWKRRYSAKKTYDFKEPTNRSHPITKNSPLCSKTFLFFTGGLPHMCFWCYDIGRGKKKASFWEKKSFFRKGKKEASFRIRVSFTQAASHICLFHMYT